MLASLLPLLAMSCRSGLPLLSVWRRAGDVIELHRRGDKSDVGQCKTDKSCLIALNGRPEPRNQNKAPGHRRHDAATTVSERLWILLNVLLSMSTPTLKY